ASAWLEDIFSGTEAVGLPGQCVAAFLRVVTNRRLPARGVPLEEAINTVNTWMQQPCVQVLVPGEEDWAHFRKMMLEGHASGPLASDAEVAALTIEYGGVLYTADRDFARFPGLRWKNPIV